MRLSIDLGVTKMSRTYRPKFRAKSLHVMLDVVSCRPEARTVEDRQGDDGGVSFCRWGGINGHPQGDVLGPQTFCLVCVVEGEPSLLPFCPSQSAGFLSEGVLACLLAVGRTGPSQAASTPLPFLEPRSHVISKAHLGASPG